MADTDEDEVKMNDLNEMCSMCSNCPYWEVCEPPYICAATEAKYRTGSDDSESYGCNMKYLIITKYGQYKVEAEDFEDAVQQAYNHHNGYDDVMAIVKIEN